MLDEAIEQSHLLRSQWPAAGHLLHMASHIDMQLGKYEATIEANSAGILQDDALQCNLGVIIITMGIKYIIITC